METFIFWPFHACSSRRCGGGDNTQSQWPLGSQSVHDMTSSFIISLYLLSSTRVRTRVGIAIPKSILETPNSWRVAVEAELLQSVPTRVPLEYR